MLRGTVLNSEASLNEYNVIDSLEFIPGEQVRLVFQIYNPQNAHQLRQVQPDTAEVSVLLPQSDHTDLEKAATAFDLDRSIWYVDLSEAETALIVGGNIRFNIDVLGDGTHISRGYISNGLSLVIVDWSC